jgi:hypothetical protein
LFQHFWYIYIYIAHELPYIHPCEDVVSELPRSSHLAGREHLDDEGPSPARVHDMQGPLRDGDAEMDGVVVSDDDGAQVDDVDAGGEARRQEVLEGDAELREEMQKRIWDRSFGHLPTPPATPVRQQAM